MARPKSVDQVLVLKDVTIDPASLNTLVGLDQTATVKGLRVGYPVLLWATALEAGLVISNAHCSAADTLKFRLSNVSTGTINAASQTFRVVQR